MIFRITFNDNDYQNVLEKIGKNMFCLYSYYRTHRLVDTDEPEKIKEYIEDAKDMDKFLKRMQNEDEFTANDKGRLVRLLLRNIRAYIEDYQVEQGEYLCKELSVEIVESVDSKYENSEVLYYFPILEQYIIK